MQTVKLIYLAMLILLIVPLIGFNMKRMSVKQIGAQRRIKWGVVVAIHLNRSNNPLDGGRGSLPLGQSVNLIIMDKVRDIHIPTDIMDEMVTALAKGIAVTRVHDDG